MPIRAGDPIERAQIVLNDNAPAYVRWPKDEMLKWLNDGAAEIVLNRPAAGAITEVVQLAAGTLQTLPAGGIELLDVTRNFTDATTAGRSITPTKRALLDDLAPDWHTLTKKNAVKHFTFDELTPDRFYSYPPVLAGTRAEIVYSRAPDIVGDIDELLNLDRAYMGPLVSYIVFRASSKDSEYADAQLALAHQQLFMQSIAGQNQTTAAASPNARAA